MIGAAIKVLLCILLHSSLNPAVDIDQVEGAFMMGVGYWLSEKMNYDATTGELLSAGTCEYKPPTSQVFSS